jgi:hypothetical protein
MGMDTRRQANTRPLVLAELSITDSLRPRCRAAGCRLTEYWAPLQELGSVNLQATDAAVRDRPLERS